MTSAVNAAKLVILRPLAAVATAAVYAFMRVSEPWTPYTKVYGLRLLPCHDSPEEGLRRMKQVLEALAQRNPAAASVLPKRLRYLSTVSGETQPPFSHLSGLRLLRVSMQYLESQPIEAPLGMLERIATTGHP